MERGGLSTLAWPRRTACLAGGIWMVSGQAGHEGRLQREQIQSYPPVGQCKWTPGNLGLLGPGVFYGISFFLTPISVFLFSIVAYFESVHSNDLIDKN